MSPYTRSESGFARGDAHAAVARNTSPKKSIEMWNLPFSTPMLRRRKMHSHQLEHSTQLCPLALTSQDARRYVLGGTPAVRLFDLEGDLWLHRVFLIQPGPADRGRKCHVDIDTVDLELRAQTLRQAYATTASQPLCAKCTRGRGGSRLTSDGELSWRVWGVADEGH